MIYGMDLTTTVPINEEGDELDIEVHVEYEKIRRQPDVGIMSDYAEITNVSVPKEYQDNPAVIYHLSEPKMWDWLSDKVNDKLKD